MKMEVLISSETFLTIYHKIQNQSSGNVKFAAVMLRKLPLPFSLTQNVM